MSRARILLVAVAALAALGAGCRTAVDAPAAPVPPPTPPADQTSASTAGAASGEAAPAAAEVYKNTIRWKTASELDNFGFDVYRAESEDGPFERLNPEPIEGAGTTDEPRSYAYVDDTIDPRKTYYYYVESISMAGVREKFTPVGKAAPKIPPADPDGGQPGEGL